MKDQLTHWNNAHTNQWLHEHSAQETDFARDVHAYIPASSTILELGCGEGNDSFYFAEQGHVVTATDFSDVAITQNTERWTNDNLTFAVQDLAQPFPQADASFDVIYTRLSLHYFTDDTTRRIFKDIARILKPGGLLCFMCKSTQDSIYGKGDLIEQDMYELNGHVRHFFSQEYAEDLLHDAGLDSGSIVMGEEKIYDRQSAFIKVMAKK